MDDFLSLDDLSNEELAIVSLMVSAAESLVSQRGDQSLNLLSEWLRCFGDTLLENFPINNYIPTPRRFDVAQVVGREIAA